MKTSLRLLPLLAAAFALNFASDASADTVVFNSYNPGTGLYPVYWNSQNPVLLSSALSGPQSGSTVAGVFDLTINGLQTQSFCIDLTHFVSPYGVTNTSYSYVDPLSVGLTQAQVTDLGRLLTSYGSLINTAPENSAAFQMAVWEITNESTGIYNLGAGNFTESGNTQSVALANNWISNLGTQDNYNIGVLKSSNNNQAQITWSAVPEPGSALLIMSFGLIGIFRRRRIA
jgi:hypothetical protein